MTHVLLDLVATAVLAAAMYELGRRRGVRSTRRVLIRIWGGSVPERTLGLADSMSIVAPPWDPFRFQVVAIGENRADPVLLDATALGPPPPPMDQPPPEGGRTIQ